MAKRQQFKQNVFIVSSGLSVLLFTVALTTNNWLVIYEPLHDIDVMGETTYIPLDDSVSVSMEMTSPEQPAVITEDMIIMVAVSNAGLFRICSQFDQFFKNGTLMAKIEGELCFNPVFFGQGWETNGTRDPKAETTYAIQRGTRKAALGLLLSYVILLSGVICGVRGIILSTVYTLVGTILCVFTGLILLTSIMLYMLAVVDEVGHRPKRNDGGLHFSHTYSWSLWSATASYFFINMAAVVNIYIYQSQNDLQTQESMSDIAKEGITSMKRLAKQLVQIGSWKKNGRSGAGIEVTSSESIELSPVVIL